MDDRESRLSKETKDLVVVLVMAAIVIAGFYIVLRQEINFEEVPTGETVTHSP